MTDVTFHPTGNVGYQGAPALSSTTTHASADASGLEMAAFEKGRMQGEMEAIRRMEAEQGAMQLKQFPAEQAAVLAAPDVVEINRLTWLQRAAAVLGELAALSSVVLTIVWFMVYRDNFGWSADGDNANGNTSMWNTGFLAGILGFFCLSQAILMYRILPLHTPNGMNKLIYYFWQACAAVGFSMFMAALVMTPSGDRDFWSVDRWCYALGFAVWGSHMLYSFFRLCIERRRPVDHETWAEHPNRVTFGSPEQRRDHSVANEYGRTLYAPQPHLQGAKRMAAQAAQQATTGTHVPSAMAPRWSELPTHHAEDYFLLPRAKWAICGYFGITAGILMVLSAIEHTISAGRSNWAQGPAGDALDQDSGHSDIIGALGLLTLGSCLLIAYAAMPPRTTLIKQNTGMAARRTSISHNAETRVGNIV